MITILFWAKMGNDVVQAGYIYEYGVLAVLGTMAILLVQAHCSVAVIWYFQVKKVHPGNIWTTGVMRPLRNFSSATALSRRAWSSQNPGCAISFSRRAIDA